MSERGPEIDMSSFESKFTVGKVEKPVEQKIEQTANKILESGILKKDSDKTEQDRDNEVNGIIESLGTGFKSYKDVVDATCDDSRPEAQKNGQETFDILKKSVSIAINSGKDKELQTRLFTGGVSEVLPESLKYDNLGTSDLDLAEGVMEVTITDQNILEKIKKLDKTKKRADLTNENEREYLAGKVETTVNELLDMDVSEEKEDELMAVKSYLSSEAGILKGELKTADNSADKEDVTAVLGEKLAEVVEKMDEMTSVFNAKNNKEEKNKNRYTEKYERKHLIENNPKELTNIARKNLDTIEGREELSNRYRGLDTQPTSVLDDITERLNDELIPETKKKIEILKDGKDIEKIQQIKEEELKNKRTIEEDLEGYKLLQQEIKARLTIFDIGKLMVDAGFRIADRGGVSDVIDQAAKMNRIMDREVMQFCFQDATKAGFDIPGAWNLIEKANFEYEELLGEIWTKNNKELEKLGYTKDNFTQVVDSLVSTQKKDKNGKLIKQKEGLFLDKERNFKRAGIVEDYIISELGENGGKAYALANELINATAERPAFNFNFIKGDNFSEAVYFKDYRKDDADKGKKVGPFATRGIKSLAHGWLRYFSDESDDLSGDMGMIKAENIQIDEIKGKKDSFMYFGKILPSYVATVKSALMDSDPDPKKILNLSHFQELVGSFDKVDVPYKLVKTADGGWRRAEGEEKENTEIKSRGGVQNMKVLYILGLLEVFATKENIGWDTNAMSKFREVVVDTNLSETKKSFINEAQWKWILEQKIAHNAKGKDLTYIEAMRTNRKSKFMDVFWQYFVNGGKLGK